MYTVIPEYKVLLDSSSGLVEEIVLTNVMGYTEVRASLHPDQMKPTG